MPKRAQWKERPLLRVEGCRSAQGGDCAQGTSDVAAGRVARGGARRAQSNRRHLHASYPYTEKGPLLVRIAG